MAPKLEYTGFIFKGKLYKKNTITEEQIRFVLFTYLQPEDCIQLRKNQYEFIGQLPECCRNSIGNSGINFHNLIIS
jgi:hypothetical protein